ncbi:MAG: cytochrome P450 [Actinomycetota bacterium]|nr:cytochrome P450 [Actinomycetota bacterium]
MQEVLKAVFTGVALRAVGSRHERPRRRTVTSVPARGTRVIVDARLPSPR